MTEKIVCGEQPVTVRLRYTRANIVISLEAVCERRAEKTVRRAAKGTESPIRCLVQIEPVGTKNTLVGRGSL